MCMVWDVDYACGHSRESRRWDKCEVFIQTFDCVGDDVKVVQSTKNCRTCRSHSQAKDQDGPLSWLKMFWMGARVVVKSWEMDVKEKALMFCWEGVSCSLWWTGALQRSSLLACDTSIKEWVALMASPLSPRAILCFHSSGWQAVQTRQVDYDLYITNKKAKVTRPMSPPPLSRPFCDTFDTSPSRLKTGHLRRGWYLLPPWIPRSAENQPVSSIKWQTKVIVDA